MYEDPLPYLLLNLIKHDHPFRKRTSSMIFQKVFLIQYIITLYHDILLSDGAISAKIMVWLQLEFFVCASYELSWSLYEFQIHDLSLTHISSCSYFCWLCQIPSAQIQW